MPNAVRGPGVKMMRKGPLHVGQRKLVTASAVPDIATELTCSHAAFASGEIVMVCEAANAKLTDDEERAKDARIGTCG
jgi:hypothetical protein